MKKYVFLLFVIILLLFALNRQSAAYSDRCQKTIMLENINVVDLEDYINKHDFHILAVCAVNYCSDLKGTNLKNSVSIFRHEYLEYIKNNSSYEEYWDRYYKGFRIDKIVINSCY